MKKKEKNVISIDVSWLGNTGIGRVAAEVIERCPSEWSINEIRANLRNASILTPISLGLNMLKYPADLFWSPGFMPPLFNLQGLPWLITIHDLTHLHYYSKFHKIYFNNVIRPLLKNADGIITVSDYTANEIKLWSGIPNNKIHRIYNGVSSNFSINLKESHFSNPYILYIGNRRNYKNIEMLFYAFSESKIALKGYRLALSGNRDEETIQYEKRYGVEGYVIYLGFIDESKLPLVYSNASAVLFISKYEGFGLPIIEAMASGTPVITSNITSMPEIADGAGLTVDPMNVCQISNAIKSVLFDGNIREALIRKGIKRASHFSWEQTAKSYWDLFSMNLVKS